MCMCDVFMESVCDLFVLCVCVCVWCVCMYTCMLCWCYVCKCVCTYDMLVLWGVCVYCGVCWDVFVLVVYVCAGRVCMLYLCYVCKCDVGTCDVLVLCVLVCMCDTFVLLVCTCVGVAGEKNTAPGILEGMFVTEFEVKSSCFMKTQSRGQIQQ